MKIKILNKVTGKQAMDIEGLVERLFANNPHLKKNAGEVEVRVQRFNTQSSWEPGPRTTCISFSVPIEGSDELPYGFQVLGYGKTDGQAWKDALTKDPR